MITFNALEHLELVKRQLEEEDGALPINQERANCI
jgi:hypothetical protein